MTLTLSSPLSAIKGVGGAGERAFAAAGIDSVAGLLWAAIGRRAVPPRGPGRVIPPVLSP